MEQMQEIKEIENTLEKRKKKIKETLQKWFKNPYDLGATLAILFTAIVRYYLLFKSKNQALWFDEASYLVMARNWAIGSLAYPEPVRDYLVSLIWTPFIKLGMTEFGLRFLTVSVGIASFYFLYVLVSHFFGKKIGLISIILSSAFIEHIFWSLRLDVGTYAIFFMLVSLVCFIKATKTNKTLFFILAGVFAALSLQAHTIGIGLLFAYAIFIPIQTKFKFYKSKKFWMFFFAFVLITSLFFVRNIISFNQIYPRLQEGWFERGGEGFSFSESLVYVRTLPGLIGMASVILFLIGLVISLDIFLILDKLFKNQISKKNLGKIFFILFGFISLALGIQSMMGPGGGIFEPRYIIPFYFSCFIFTAIAISFISNKIKNYSKFLSILFIIVIIAFIIYPQLTKTNDLVNIKKDSYQGIKQAGLWFKQNSNPEDIILTFEGPQISYYSNRKTINYPSPDSEEIKQKILNKKPEYILIWTGLGQTYFQRVMNIVSENNESFTLVEAFPSIYSQPTVGVYKIEDSFFESVEYSGEIFEDIS